MLDDEAPYPYGTAISFEATETIASIRNAAENAARHYPLPVVFEDCTEDGTAGPEGAAAPRLPRRCGPCRALARPRLRRLQGPP